MECARRGLDLHPETASAPVRARDIASVHVVNIRILVTRLLVVEDEESFSEALSYMLRKEGSAMSWTTRPTLVVVPRTMAWACALGE